MQLAACLLALASLAALGRAVEEGEYSDGWTKSRAPVSDQHPVSFTIVINEQGLEELQRISRAVSDPTSPSYGHYLSQTQLDALVTPNPADIATVLRWLGAAQVPYERGGRSSIVVHTDAGTAGRLLRTRFHLIQHRARAQAVVLALGKYVIE
jgi:subtilase family serine protease